MTAIIRLTQGLASGVATPPSGATADFLDQTTGVRSYKDSSGTVHVMSLDGASTATYGTNTTAIATTAFVQQALSTKVADGNSSTALTVNWTTGNIHTVTMTGNCTFTFTAPSPALGVLILALTQDGTGSRTATWPGTVKWSGGTAPTLTTTASKTDIFTFYYDGTSYYGVTSGLNY